MQFSAQSDNSSTLSTPCLLLPVYSEGEQAEITQQVDQQHGQIISRLLEQGDIQGKAADTLLVHVNAGSQTQRLLLVGMGEAGKTSATDFIKAASAAAKALKSSISSSVLSSLLEIGRASCRERV